ncbi:polysaccharide biosynthesis/export family protein [Thalassolituus oleivorans]|jgi:polysaccharide export outer membrane protein|uniref:polysaccharide biosynthesis/export family protein n=1 Tax=Thalassolituus oleivorans TaxID=187493 RepID=UPI000BD80B66|nr:polysaccharide biosynthesis/export family protein [Thalassolituus oleivorans]PCI50771.1 MAG: capsular biosynthesis protein [Oceanospirillales bacterium]
MLRLVSLLFVVLFSFSSFAEDGSYRLGAGDLITISVYDEPDLSQEVRIGLSGDISYPLLGNVRVAGLSPKELEQKLVSGLKGPYLLDPSVTVSILEYRPFYVTGEVEKPGSYAFHPGLTVDKAISIAGGFTERASKNRIYVMHDDSANKPNHKGSDGLAAKDSIKLFDVVQPGDVITVEQSFF